MPAWLGGCFVREAHAMGQTIFPTEEQKREMTALRRELQRVRDVLMMRKDTFRPLCAPTRDEPAAVADERSRRPASGDRPYAIPNVDSPTEEGALLWTLYGISAVMDIDQALVADAIERIRASDAHPEDLKRRVEECRHAAAGRVEALYDDRIFDVLLDSRQEERLQDILQTEAASWGQGKRRALPTIEDAEQIRQFWDALSELHEHDVPRDESSPAPTQEDMERIRRFWSELGKPSGK